MNTTPIKRLSDACSAVREYRGSEVLGHVDEMLVALMEGYKADLEHVSEDQLKPLQAKLRQVSAIRKVILGEEALPRI